MFQKVLDHHQNDIPDASAKNPMVPQQLSHILRRMMAGQVEARYQRPDDLIRDLLPLAAALGVPAGGGIWSELAPPRFAWAEHRGWILALGVWSLWESWPACLPAKRTRCPPRMLPQSPVRSVRPRHRRSHLNRELRKRRTTRIVPRPCRSPRVCRRDEDAGQCRREAARPAGALAKAQSPSTILEATTAQTPVSPPTTLSTNTDENRFWADSAGIFKGYASLEAACLAAVDGSTIELRFDGKSSAQKRCVSRGSRSAFEPRSASAPRSSSKFPKSSAKALRRG